MDVFAAAKAGDVERLRQLILVEKVHHDVDSVDEFDKLKNTALHNAAWKSQLNCMEMLLDAKANPDCKNKDGTTPLHYAAWSGSIESMRMLLQAQADPNGRDYLGHTPLLYAATYATLPCVKVLVEEYGVDAWTKTNEGETALDYVSAEDIKEYLKIVMEDAEGGGFVMTKNAAKNFNQ